MTPSRPALARFAALVVGFAGMTAHLVAQDADQPRAFLSTSAKEPTTGKAKESVGAIALRPNTEFPFHVYVTRPGGEAWDNKLTVLVASSKDARIATDKSVLAHGTLDKVGPMGIVKVALIGATDDAKAPPAEPPVGDKPPAAAPKTSAGTPVPPIIYLIVLDEEGKLIKGVDPLPVSVRIRRPSDYLYAIPTLTATASGAQLSVEVGDRFASATEKNEEPFRGPPAKVRLDVRPELIPNLDRTNYKEGGSFESVVPSGGKNVRLVAKNLRFVGSAARSYVTVSADGFDRAFVFQTDFGGGNNPQPVRESFVRIDAPRFAIPGKPLAARLEVFNEPDAGRPKLEFFRTDEGEPEVVTADLTTSRDRKLTLRVGKAGELVFAAEVKDWVVPLNTTGVYGTRKLRFTLDGVEGGRKPDPVEVPLTLDDTPPELVRVRVILPPPTLYAEELEKARKAKLIAPVLVPLPEDFSPEAERNKVVELVADLRDRESGIDPTKVLFYVGSPPVEGKVAPGSLVASGAGYIPTVLDPKSGKLVRGDRQPDVYAARLRLPDVKGRVKIGVVFANNVGLVQERVAEIIVVDPPEPPTTGTLEGRVIQGSTPERPQPGLAVTLLNAARQPIGSATTNAEGVFKFTDLKPGPYQAFSVKAADQNAQATVPGTVVAGRTTKVTLELRR